MVSNIRLFNRDNEIPPTTKSNQDESTKSTSFPAHAKLSTGAIQSNLLWQDVLLNNA